MTNSLLNKEFFMKVTVVKDRKVWEGKEIVTIEFENSGRCSVYVEDLINLEKGEVK